MATDIHYDDSSDRVRRNSPRRATEHIDSQTLARLHHYASGPAEAIGSRIGELDREWDMERVLGANAATIGLVALGLAVGVNAWWALLILAVLAFLLQHALQGWCPPVPLFRRMGVRTRREIDREKYALKVLRGDFDGLGATGLRDRARRDVPRVWESLLE